MTEQERLEILIREYGEATPLGKVLLVVKATLSLLWALLQLVATFIVPIIGAVYLLCMAANELSQHNVIGLFILLMVCAFMQRFMPIKEDKDGDN